MAANWMKSALRFGYVVLISLLISGCKETSTKEFDNNNAVSPHRISTIKIEGYVNRLFIDLVGRSPLESELARETEYLKENNLSKEAREAIVVKLQTDETPVVGDSSYRIAYYERLYIIIKSRMVEGADDSEFTRLIGLASNSLDRARLVGDSIGVFRALDLIKRNKDVIDAKYDYRNGEININQVFERMMNNGVYDIINMNTFNFVNASFDDLFYRFPSQEEFDAAYGIIERNEVAGILGGFAGNKGEYCQVLCASDEFYEGIIRWTYLTLLGREPSTQEVVNHFEDYALSGDFQALQKSILITDEYADFR